MKAITISQPYASLIASGEKWVENRTWPTAYRGPLAIHAGKGTQYLTRQELRQWPTGCVIAIAKLMGCVNLHSCEDLRACVGSRTIQGIALHPYAEGPWCWVLEGVQAIEPIPTRGMQGLWEWQVGIVVEKS